MSKKLSRSSEMKRRQPGPAWFQELSEIQIIGADSIFDAISYGAENVQYLSLLSALTALGLNPLPSKREVVEVIQFSRGNDLALLWRLYDTVYNSCADIRSKTSFSMNERLLLSCICHLDMMTTLRLLDRILPNPSQPKRSFSHPKFELYKKYKEPSHVIKNESNRWFVGENVLSSESRNISKAIVCSQVREVVHANFDRSKVSKVLCEKHQLESRNLAKLIEKALESQTEIDEDSARLQDSDIFERGIIYGVQLDQAEAEQKVLKLEKNLENQIIVMSQVEKIIANAFNNHICEQCDGCAKASKKAGQKNPSILRNEEHEHDEAQIKFFHRPSTTSPFKFDCEKIYSTSYLNDGGVIKNSINAALEVDKHLTKDNAITVSLKDMWAQEMINWNEKRSSEMTEKLEKVVTDCTKIGSNKRRILRLLCQGITVMRKNPRFVLASLPGVERVPLLREWILQRFGIQYDSKFNEMRLKKNKMYRERLDMFGIVPKMKIPTSRMFGVKSTLLTYEEAHDKRKTLKRDVWLKKYYKSIAAGIIERHREYWSTMEPFLCNTERMRQIFYAYMPPRERDIEKIVMNETFS